MSIQDKKKKGPKCADPAPEQVHLAIDPREVRSRAMLLGFHVAATRPTIRKQNKIQPHDATFRMVHPMVDHFALDICPRSGTTKLQRFGKGGAHTEVIKKHQTSDDVIHSLLDMRNYMDIDTSLFN